MFQSSLLSAETMKGSNSCVGSSTKWQWRQTFDLSERKTQHSRKQHLIASQVFYNCRTRVSVGLHTKMNCQPCHLLGTVHCITSVAGNLCVVGHFSDNTSKFYMQGIMQLCVCVFVFACVYINSGMLMKITIDLCKNVAIQ